MNAELVEVSPVWQEKVLAEAYRSPEELAIIKVIRELPGQRGDVSVIANAVKRPVLNVASDLRWLAHMGHIEHIASGVWSLVGQRRLWE